MSSANAELRCVDLNQIQTTSLVTLTIPGWIIGFQASASQPTLPPALEVKWKFKMNWTWAIEVEYGPIKSMELQLQTDSILCFSMPIGTKFEYFFPWSVDCGFLWSNWDGSPFIMSLDSGACPHPTTAPSLSCLSSRSRIKVPTSQKIGLRGVGPRFQYQSIQWTLIIWNGWFKQTLAPELLLGFFFLFLCFSSGVANGKTCGSVVIEQKYAKST